MDKPKEFFDFGLSEKTAFLKKSGLRKKTTPDQWAWLAVSKVDGLFTQHMPDHARAVANYEAENLHIAFELASDMNEWKKYLEMHPPSPEALAVLILVAVGEANSSRAKLVATKGHAEKGRSRDKRKTIQESWASGNFKSRAICAEQECAYIGMSISTAIKALRNTPDPNPWPAKTTKKKP